MTCYAPSSSEWHKNIKGELTDHKDGKPEDWNYRILIPAMEKQIQVLKRHNDMLEQRVSTLEKICANMTKERGMQDGDH